MTKHRPDGEAKMQNYGNWTLEKDGKVNAMCQRGETVVYYPTGLILFNAFRRLSKRAKRGYET